MKVPQDLINIDQQYLIEYTWNQILSWPKQKKRTEYKVGLKKKKKQFNSMKIFPQDTESNTMAKSQKSVKI